jgi:hypothetical protein
MSSGLTAGYMVVEEKDGLYLGAALVVDSRGVPVDFRYTEPLRPTKIERILYGGALEVYLREDVIVKSLAEAVEAKPAIWIVRDPELLAAVRRHGKVLAASLEGTSNSPLDRVGQVEMQGELEFLLQVDPISSPLRVTVTKDQVQQIKKVSESLVFLGETMEVMEPFGRISRALEALRDEPI